MPVAARPTPAEPIDLPYDEWKKALDENVARAKEREHRYPPGFEAHDCKGKVSHDARLVAAMRAHNITHLLTFNVADFARFSNLTVLDPAAVGSRILP